MFKHAIVRLTGIALLALPGLLCAQSPIQAELRFVAPKSAEKNAGVWVDGQYVGYVQELTGDKKMILLPGKHEIIVRQAWYKDYVEQPVLEPGEVHVIKLALQKDSRSPTPAAAANVELKIDAQPSRAVVFVDNQFVGHVNEFQGAGKALLLTSGQHSLRLALPGYQPFETVLNVRAHQKLKIQTELVKGSITQAGALVSEQ